MGFLKTLSKKVSSSSHLSLSQPQVPKTRTPSPLRSKPPSPPPAPAPSAPRVAILGAGSRGNAYARALHAAVAAHVVAVAEPRDEVRNRFGKRYIWGEGPELEGQAFKGWEDWAEWEKERRAKEARGEEVPRGASVVFVCVLDDVHLAVVKACAEMGGLHIMCEKPLAGSLQETLEMYSAVRAGWRRTGKRTIFGIGHVLRYSPHNVLLRKLVREEKVVGDVMSIEHTEPVGWWHFSHSYVR